MIQLTMYRQADGNYTGFSCKGHAGYADHGQDIVCAGVSALVLTVVQSLETLTEDKTEVSVEEAAGSVRCMLQEPSSEKARLLLDALFLGCQSIRKEYGKQYITIKFREV